MPKIEISISKPIAASVNGMNNGIFSCRAECDIDVANFLSAAENAKTVIDVRTRSVDPNDPFKIDVILEFESSASIDSLLAIMRECADLHVMRQSLRPCALDQNSLDRDGSID